MTQSFVGTGEQVLSALMHAIKTVSGDNDGILDCGRFARFAHATVIRRGSLSIVTLTVLLTDYAGSRPFQNVSTSRYRP
jgi:hypothetical protein